MKLQCHVLGCLFPPCLQYMLMARQHNYFCIPISKYASLLLLHIALYKKCRSLWLIIQYITGTCTCTMYVYNVRVQCTCTMYMCHKIFSLHYWIIRKFLLHNLWYWNQLFTTLLWLEAAGIRWSLIMVLKGSHMW